MTWKTVTTRYKMVSQTTKRRLTCEVCGKRFTRQRTFTHTINPFNKNAAGVPKTYHEVLVDVEMLAAQWQPEPDCGRHEATS